MGFQQNGLNAGSSKLEDLEARRVAGGKRVGTEETQFKNPKMGAKGACPYVLNDESSPPASPFYRCKSPFVPSFKKATKMMAFPSFLWARVDAFIQQLTKWGRNADGLVENLWSHMKLGGSVSGTVLGKLRVGTRIVRRGGVENLFKLIFSSGSQEKLLKTCACYLSISSGPLAGLIFVSTHKIAFCSDRPIAFRAKNGRDGCCYYRVAIPNSRVKCVNPSENTEKPSDKYIQVETVDGYEFWFMGFVHFDKALKHLQEQVLTPLQ